MGGAGRLTDVPIDLGVGLVSLTALVTALASRKGERMSE